MAEEPGAQHREALTHHEARSALRFLAGQFFDAWDAADLGAIRAVVTPDADWVDAEPQPLVDGWLATRAGEPWSFHWLGNEEIRSEADAARGTWLWWAAIVDRAAGSLWAGGDLAVAAVRTSHGWRISRVERTHRYRTPVTLGWHRQAMVARPADHVPALAGAEALGRASIDQVFRSGSLGASSAAVTAERLLEEHRLEGLLWHQVDDLDVVSLPPSPSPDTTLVMRTIAAPVLQLSPDTARAWARHRDLCAVDVGGQARWWVHLYDSEVYRRATSWTVASMRAQRVLDVAYGDDFELAT